MTFYKPGDRANVNGKPLKCVEVDFGKDPLDNPIPHNSNVKPFMHKDIDHHQVWDWPKIIIWFLCGLSSLAALVGFFAFVMYQLTPLFVNLYAWVVS